jgi:glycosyltransferase involved in cell wall biosynthesis
MRAAARKEEPARVLHVITGLAPGGAEDQLRLLAPRLRSRGIVCDVAAFYNLGSVADALREQGVRVVDLRSPRFSDPLGALRLIGEIRKGRYDIVHTHLFRAGLHGRWAARGAGVATIVHTEHSLNGQLIEGRQRGPVVDAVYRCAERLGTLTLAVSKPTAAEICATGVPEHRIRVLPNGIDPEAHRFQPSARARCRARHGIAPDAKVVAVTGRLVASKRFEVALEAVAALDEAVLLVVGDGPQRAALEQRAAVRLPGRAAFTGELPAEQVTEALAAADAFASPSPQETFGLSALAAVACGLPTVYVASPALDAAAADGRARAALIDAVRVPCQPAAMAAALSAALRRPRGPGAVPADFHIDTVADRLAAIYARLLNAADRPNAERTGAARHA